MNAMRMNSGRWMAAILFAAAFFVPNIHTVHATDMEPAIDAGGHEMTCQGDVCTPWEPSQDCLEHCLQAATALDQIPAVFVSGVQTGLIVEPEAFVLLPGDQQRAVSQITGPPNRLVFHLSVQKRE